MKPASCGTLRGENKRLFVRDLVIISNYLSTLEPNGDANQSKQRAAQDQVSQPEIEKALFFP